MRVQWSMMEAAVTVLLVAVLILPCLFSDGAAQVDIREQQGRGQGVQEFHPGDVEVPEQARDVAARFNRFGWELFEAQRSAQPDKNLFMSPASAAIALSMTLNGAEGMTGEEMAEVLELSGISDADLNAANESLRGLLDNPEPDVQLAMANSLWLTDVLQFYPEFLDPVTQAYGAAIETVNMRDPSTVHRINGWVAEATREKITKVIERTSPQDVFFIINAIYFKGNWRHKFDPAATKPQDFHLLDGTTREHPLMYDSRKFGYHETPDFQMVALPYGTGRMRMIVMLPSESSSLDAFMADLTPEKWDTMLGFLHKRKGAVALPKFRMEWESLLNDPLMAMGIQQAFEPTSADFSGMCRVTGDTSVYIGQVLQKTFVEVSEEGTEAAAVTVVRGLMTTSVGDVSMPFEMIVDRPFLIAIQDQATGLILFTGAIVDPPVIE